MNNIRADERAILSLRELYDRYGYTQYKMSRFEEYDLYVRNKDFLVSDQVITFTDRSGRLLALKPDVTLSIIKNSDPMGIAVQKVYYHENVYRVDPASHAFREIPQVGLECIGSLGEYEIAETVLLAVKSLALMGKPYVLELSHMGLVRAMLDDSGLPEKEKPAALALIQQKNAHELESLCAHWGASWEKLSALLREGLDGLEHVLRTHAEKAAYGEFSRLWSVLERCGVSRHVRVDFSVGSDMKYYCGAVFKGYLQGVPDSVLSGGQYDRLLAKLGRKGSAIGFAIYANLLERLYSEESDYDVDTVLLYGEDDDPVLVFAAAEAAAAQGRVLTAKTVPDGLVYRRLMKLCDGEAVLLEEHG